MSSPALLALVTATTVNSQLSLRFSHAGGNFFPLANCGLSVSPGVSAASIIRTRLSGNDVNHALHLLEFGLTYIKDHFDSVVPISRNFKKEARWTELN